MRALKFLLLMYVLKKVSSLRMQNSQMGRWMQMSSSASGKLQRIERIISNRGVGSRKEVQKMLKQGRVTVDGKLVRSSSARYSPDVVITVDEEEISPVPLLALYHKPVGVVSSMNDYGSWGRETLQSLQEEFSYLKSMHPVGRLDKDTSGLLLFSSNGQLTNYLLSPKSEIEREYEAIVANEVDENALSSVLDEGVNTSIGVFKAKLLESKILDQRLPKSLVQQIEKDAETDMEEKDESKGQREEEREEDDADEGEEETVSCSYVRLSVIEGKHRMVRRILHNANAGREGGKHSVINLHRVRYGEIMLSEELEEGEVMPCSPADADWAMKLGSFKQ